MKRKFSSQRVIVKFSHPEEIDNDKACLCKRVPISKEKYVVSVGFIILNLIQSIFVMFLCGLSVHYFSKTNIAYFLAVDVISLLIAVIILGFMIIVVGWAAALTNTGLGWVMFHSCMTVLLSIEILLSILTSDPTSVMNSVATTWANADNDTKLVFQNDLQCCGFNDINDQPAYPCNSQSGCLEKLGEIFKIIRWVTSTAMFICFIFGLFVDLMGVAICFQPELISLDEQQREENLEINFELEDNYRNPFQI